jgi:hypothetical protein
LVLIQTTLLYIPEDGNFDNYRCETLKSYRPTRVRNKKFNVDAVKDGAMKDEYREMLAQQRTNLLKAVLTQK